MDLLRGEGGNMNTKVVKVRMAESHVGKAPQTLEAPGLGSCVAICFYDPKLKVGGLAHAMLPSLSDWDGTKPPANPMRFADYAIDWMISELKKLGSALDSLEAKVIGGADMFEVSRDNPEAIGTQTVKKVEEKLKSLEIKLMAEDVGENVGRSVSFDLETGIVTVSTKM